MEIRFPVSAEKEYVNNWLGNLTVVEGGKVEVGEYDSNAAYSFYRARERMADAEIGSIYHYVVTSYVYPDEIDDVYIEKTEDGSIYGVVIDNNCLVAGEDELHLDLLFRGELSNLMQYGFHHLLGASPWPKNNKSLNNFDMMKYDGVAYVLVESLAGVWAPKINDVNNAELWETIKSEWLYHRYNEIRTVYPRLNHVEKIKVKSPEAFLLKHKKKVADEVIRLDLGGLSLVALGNFKRCRAEGALGLLELADTKFITDIKEFAKVLLEHRQKEVGIVNSFKLSK